MSHLSCLTNYGMTLTKKCLTPVVLCQYISVGARLVLPFSYLSQSPALCFFSVKSRMKALLQGKKAIRRTFLLTMLALPFQKKTWKLYIH